MHSQDSTKIIGYYSLCSYSCAAVEFPDNTLKGFPRSGSIPCTLLTKLAIDLEYCGRGYGKELLTAALQQVLDSSKRIASVMILVDTNDEEARGFYEHYGFSRLPTQPFKLFLPISTLEMATRK